MWLIRKKRFEEAFGILQKAANKRGKQIHYNKFLLIVKTVEEEKQEAILVDQNDGRNVEGYETLLKDQMSSKDIDKNANEFERLKDEDRPGKITSGFTLKNPFQGDRSPSLSVTNPEGFRAALRSRIYIMALLATGYLDIHFHVVIFEFISV